MKSLFNCLSKLVYVRFSNYDFIDDLFSMLFYFEKLDVKGIDFL